MKKLSFLLKSVAHYEVYGDAEIEISSLDFDSRKIVASDQGCSMYVAQKGTQFDGHLFINQVIEKGARAIVCEEMPQEICSEVTYVKVENSAVALGFLASAFYDDPSTKIKLVGITGTNGKTTTVTLLHRLFMNLGYATGLLSTIQNKIEERIIPSTHTTPDALELNRLLHEMVLQGCEYCFMEVSSHAICQHRIAGVQFAGAVFSNITHDHLDFHKTFAHYITAKKAFFDHLSKESFALTNIDDKNGKVMVQNSEARIFTYSLLTAADFKGVVLDNGFEGLQMTMNGKEVFFKLSGKFNAYNLLAIYGTALLLGMEEEEVLQKMSDLDSAAGRFQMIKNQRGCTAIVDYAHTPDALKNVLSTIQDITQHSVEI
ncbi:MAG: UDP-N-acetylmuramoyl-L-alanyl-D-glutamate--2,6-diaminopimelate ligase, partial [Bacteroidales bacterium]